MSAKRALPPLFTILLFLTGCPTPTVRLEVIKPARLEVSGVTTIAVGKFHLAGSRDYFFRAKDNQWREIRTSKRPSANIADQTKYTTPKVAAKLKRALIQKSAR